MANTLRLATRGSDLARRQTATVSETLGTVRQEVELVEVETEGDRVRDELIHRLGRVGAFVRALDERVLDGEVDAAVHSMKDMPTELPDDLVVAGVPTRGPAADVLVTPGGATLAELPEGATVGTSSLRRRAFLLDERPDLTVEPLRGNVDTRLAKLLAPSLQREHARRLAAADEDHDIEVEASTVPDEGYDRTPEEWFESLTELERRALEREVEAEYDAAVLAEAGLDRLGLLDQVPHERLPTGSFVPAPGQGALAVVAREKTDAVSAVNDRVDDPATRVATTVERTLQTELGGGCVAPVGVHATVSGEYVHVDVAVCHPDGAERITASKDLPVEQHGTAAVDLAVELRDRGAAELIDRAEAKR